MKRGFSLVELLVVVAIIAILSGVLVASLTGGTASARAARCLSNMKNLATAAQTYGMAVRYYPVAGDLIYLRMDESRGIRNVRKEYRNTPGWISGDTQNKFPATSYAKPAIIGMYETDQEKARYALTNGVLWQYVSGSHDTYVCPEHGNRAYASDSASSKGGSSSAKKASAVNWSYLMNAYFGWDRQDRANSNSYTGRREYGKLARADKTLLFSEVPFSGKNTSWEPSGSSGTTDTDAILQYSDASLDPNEKGGYAGGGSAEEIGVNHKSGRNYTAHVAFADGHVEKLRVPMNGKKADTSGFADVTSWLCVGYDVSFDGNRYTRVK